MGSIRHLFTITVLLVVGGYLYWKINEGPAHPHAGAHGANEEGVPPLAATGGGATLAQDSAAPAWPPAVSTAPPAAPALSSANAAADTSKNGMPEVPPIPELPELPKTADITPPATSVATASAAPLAAESAMTPAGAADSRYGDSAGPQLGLGASSPALGALPPLPGGASATANDQTTPLTTIPGGAPSSLQSLPTTPSNTLGASATTPIPPAASMPPTATAPPAAAPLNSLRPAAPAAAQGDDRYGGGASSATALPAASPMTSTSQLTSPQSAPIAAAGGTFAASWPAIQAALDHNDLKQAHQMLSKWHGNESLSPAESQKVESLLGQLAGTVIYSPEYELEPARVVKPGETLETIAKEYSVPWQLLAKINSVAAPDQVRPGQSLKVVRGPFSGVVDLHRNELTLEVDGRYAGTFAVTLPPGAVPEGQWLVDQKLAGPQSAVTPTAYATPAAAPDRTIILRNAASAGTVPGGPALMIASGTPAPGATAIRVAPQDAEDLSDILSIGSRIVVRR